jgi:hypothetical protein
MQTPLIFGVLVLAWCLASLNLKAEETRVPVTITGGHETEPQDHGRPVVLVAAGLGVKPEVFREAFSRVTPAKNGKPSGAEARRNKEALLKVLGPLGITNERLDEVSDYYRYQPQSGRLWRNTPAKAHAIVENGQLKKIVLETPGAGYTTPPKVTVPGHENMKLTAQLHFDKNLSKNGSISAIDVDPR